MSLDARSTKQKGKEAGEDEKEGEKQRLFARKITEQYLGEQSSHKLGGSEYDNIKVNTVINFFKEYEMNHLSSSISQPHN